MPYYSKADEYQNDKNILFLIPKMDHNFSYIEDIFLNYTRNPDVSKIQSNFDNNNTEYVNKLNNTYNSLYGSNFSPINVKNKSDFINKSYRLTTFDYCNDTEVKYQNWLTCNANKYTELNKSKTFIILPSRLTKTLDEKFGNVIDLVKKVEDYNNKTSLVNITDLHKWDTIISNWKLKYDGLSHTKLDFLSLNNYKDPKYYFSSISVNSPKNLTSKIEKLIYDYKSSIESVEYPLIGRVPVFNLNLTFISFPIILAAGFSFLSFQFKKFIIIRKKLNLKNDNVEHRLFMSWIDPLQPFPENIYPLLIMILPFILFIIFFTFIYGLWYENEPYRLAPLPDDLLSIQKLFNDVFFYLNLGGWIIFILSYLLIILAWRQKGKSDNFKSKSDN